MKNMMQINIHSSIYLDHVAKVAIAMMVLGAIMTIVALCGVLGALFENQCCLVMFFVFLFLCFLVTFAVTGNAAGSAIKM